jgi:hypothetical protein
VRVIKSGCVVPTRPRRSALYDVTVLLRNANATRQLAVLPLASVTTLSRGNALALS